VERHSNARRRLVLRHTKNYLDTLEVNDVQSQHYLYIYHICLILQHLFYSNTHLTVLMKKYGVRYITIKWVSRKTLYLQLHNYIFCRCEVKVKKRIRNRYKSVRYRCTGYIKNNFFRSANATMNRCVSSLLRKTARQFAERTLAGVFIPDGRYSHAKRTAAVCSSRP